MRAAIYLRVSTRQQDEETQLPDIERQIARDKVTLVPEYIFRDKVSGLKDEEDRQGLAALMKLTREDVDIVYIWEISRLSRNPETFDRLILHFKEEGINVCFLKPTPLYLFDLNTGSEILANTIALKLFSTFALWEIKQKTQRMQRGRREKILSNKLRYTTSIPYGYLVKDDKLAINDVDIVSDIEGFRTEKEVVESVYDLYLSGKTMMYIKKLLNQYKIPSPATRHCKSEELPFNGKKVKKEDLKWSKASVDWLLSNTTYHGYKEVTLKFATDRVEKKVVKGEIKNVPVYNYETLKVETPAIITEEKFLLVQKQKVKNINVATKSYKNQCLLRGILRCGFCGDYYIRANAYGKPKDIGESIYKCADRAKVRSDNTHKGCKNGSIYSLKIDTIVWELTKQFYVQYKQKETKTTSIETLTRDIENKKTIISAKEEYIKDIEKQENNITQRLMIVPDSIAKKLVEEANKLDVDKKNIYKEIRALNDEIAVIKSQIKSIEEIATDKVVIKNIDDNLLLKIEAVKKLVKEVLFYKYDRKISIFQIVFNTVNENTGQPDKINVLYHIWKRAAVYLPDNLYHFNSSDFMFSVKVMPDSNNMKNFSFKEEYRYYTPYEVLELEEDNLKRLTPVKFMS